MRIITDAEWQKECKRRLDKALDEPVLARKALEALDRDPKLKREIPRPLYFRVLTSAIV